MGGLQRSLQMRSQQVMGHGELILKDQSAEFSQLIHQHLNAQNVSNWREYELELLVRRRGYLSPLVIHGIELARGVPPHLKGKDMSGLALGGDLAHQLKAQHWDQLQLISPAHIDPMLGGMARQVSDTLSDLVTSDVPEVDLFHGWVRDSLLHNLIQKVEYNKIRPYTPAPGVVAKLEQQYAQQLQYYSWEQINQTLVRALRLETTVMVVLFVAMTLLVAISISSGLFIFYQKIQREMIGFWIMGASEKKLGQSFQLFIHLLALVTCGMALLSAILFLKLMGHWSPVIMPDVFVDRKIPYSYHLPWYPAVLSHPLYSSGTLFPPLPLLLETSPTVLPYPATLRAKLSRPSAKGQEVDIS